jgi:ATP-binding cassette subfamily F protein uup
MRVIEYIKEQAEILATSDGRQLSAGQMLELFLFPPHLQWTPIAKLSGGEKRRLYLLRVLMGAPNVLLLDEPTNDLDIQTLTILEDYLDSFPGAVLAVSHDRYFLDRVVGKILSFEEQGIVPYVGNYSEYLDYVKNYGCQVEKSNTPVKVQVVKPKEKLLKFTYKEQKEYEEIDELIAGAETELSIVQQQMETAGSDFTLLSELASQQQQLKNKLEYLLERWTYLYELAEQIEQQTTAST